MATARAIANGNWSATSTWNGGVVPGNGDTVYANGFNVTLDTDVNIGGANNPIVNTGSLVSGQWYEIVNVGGQTWTTLGAASNTVGTVFQSSGTGTAGNLGTARALATLTTATNAAAGANTGGGVFTMSTVRAMTCDIRAGTTTCLNVPATSGTLTLSGLRVVSGSVTGAHGVNTTANSDLASCIFTGGSGGNAYALNNASTGSVTVTNGTFTASAFTNAVAMDNTAADVRLSGNFLDHWSGWKAVDGGKWRLGTAPTLGQTRYALEGTTDSYFTMYGADNGSFGNPIAANVRSGIVYGGGNLTGTCAVPAAGSVALGVPVGATTGTAVLTPEAVWGHASRTITEGGITAADVWSHASRTITGGTVTTLTNAPTVPTPSQIASQVRTELSVELARVDQAISTRATPGDIPTESEIAAEVWAKPTTELTITGSIGERAKNQSTVSTTGAQLAAALS